MSGSFLAGVLYDGTSVAGEPATLIVSGRQVSLVGECVDLRIKRAEVSVSPRVGVTHRFVTIPGGRQFECADNSSLDLLPQEVPSEGLVAWLEQRWTMAVASLVALIVVLIAGYVFVLPKVAQEVAERISIKSEIALGDEVLEYMDRNHWVEATALDGKTRYRLLSLFAQLIEGLPMEQHYTLAFRDSAAMGANAFALPGAAIVLTDDMVRAAKSDAEILAVLAHEIGHVEQRHIVRGILQDSVMAILVTCLTADASTVGTAMASFPLLVTRMKYSREFEAEADQFAFRLMSRHSISPAVFADIMERIAERQEAGDEGSAFLSSHPLTADRIAQARAAAAATAPVPAQASTRGKH